jgi:hypothetical protein
MPERFLPFRKSHDSAHIRIKHHCGHVITYRKGADVYPAFRPCHGCATAISTAIYRSIAPHIRTKSGTGAVAKIISDLLDHEYIRQAERNPEDTGEVRLFEVVRKTG